MRRLRMVPATLHGRLLSGLLVLVTLGLVGVDVAAYTMLRSFLGERTDRQLAKTAALVDRVLARSIPLQLSGGLPGASGTGDINVLFLDSGQQVLARLPQRQLTPEQTAQVDELDTATLRRLRADPDSPVQLKLAGIPYRVLFHPTGGRLGDSRAGRLGAEVSAVVVALSFSADEDTLTELATSGIVVSTITLLVLTGLAVGALRFGLRPLGSMAAMATAIAEGDLTRRLAVDHPRTEVGRLATALNYAFDERRWAEERLRRFVADASHELRTPLTTIQGWADLYFQEGLTRTDDVEHAMARIAESAGQVCRLVEELQLLAGLDEQRPLDAGRVDLAALADEVIGDALVVDSTRPVLFTRTRAIVNTCVVGDADRLRQVVRNLLGNALQHTPAGTRIWVILTPATTACGPALRLTVADDGPGIDPSDQVRLFERFYRAAPARDRTGTGLGLAIVQAIVEAHHGMVRVQSRAGEGSQFHVTLPSWPGGGLGCAIDRPAPRTVS